MRHERKQTGGSRSTTEKRGGVARRGGMPTSPKKTSRARAKIVLAHVRVRAGGGGVVKKNRPPPLPPRCRDPKKNKSSRSGGRRRRQEGRAAGPGERRNHHLSLRRPRPHPPFTTHRTRALTRSKIKRPSVSWTNHPASKTIQDLFSPLFGAREYSSNRTSSARTLEQHTCHGLRTRPPPPSFPPVRPPSPPFPP
jgi:hypothetical protein